MNEVELFVPGRVCLLGEHSDWAGGYRRLLRKNDGEQQQQEEGSPLLPPTPPPTPLSPYVLPGKCLVYATDCGLHAKASKSFIAGSDGECTRPQFVFKSTLDGSEEKTFRCTLDVTTLNDEASKGTFFSYACGVAAVIVERYGETLQLVERDDKEEEKLMRPVIVTINNYKTDLPIKKGLSSSAAVCVLVAKAFSALFDLHLSVETIMDIAYHGEIKTPSQCGRMDQCCAYGPGVVKMVIDGDEVVGSPVVAPPPSDEKRDSAFTAKTGDDNESSVGGKAFYFVVADLGAGKDTQVILEELNQCYPVATTDIHEGVQMFLGPVNDELVEAAEKKIAAGDAQGLGELLTKAQTLFDQHLQPACPSQLTAPKLHRLLDDAYVKALTFGGKGVGSQGDGSIQFVAKSKEDQHCLVELLKGETYGCHPFAFTLAVPHAERL